MNERRPSASPRPSDRRTWALGLALAAIGGLAATAPTAIGAATAMPTTGNAASVTTLVSGPATASAPAILSGADDDAWAVADAAAAVDATVDAVADAADAADATVGAGEDDALQERRRRRRPGGDGPGGGPPAGGDGDDGGDDAAGGDAEAAEDGEAEDDEIVLETDDTYLAIVGGTVHTVSGGVQVGATILCKNGVIHEIGRRVQVPEGAEVIDATGKQVYPGLIAVRSAGLVGNGNPADSTNVFGFNMTLGLAAGITTAVTGTTAAKLTFGSIDDHVVATGLWKNLSYDTGNPRGRQRVRASFDRVRQYLRDVEAYEREKRTNPDAKAPDNRWIRGSFADHLALIKGEAKAMMNLRNAHEFIQACDLADEYGIEIIAMGGVEAWTVADRVSRSGMSVILSPRQTAPVNEETWRENGSTIQNASILRDHGVTVAITPAGSLFGPGFQISLGGLAGRDLLHLPMAAAFAVRGGMSNRAALETITLDAARILGIDHRVGSIDVGKDADFAITDGDLLHYMTHVDLTVVNGSVVYDKSKDTLFSHIRPADEPGRSHAPADDYWPRRLGDGP